ncbi:MULTISPECIES: hypothetical protein [Bacillus]|uniref:Uncharacterized protein n=2 Tax=Bacillus cereus group TaxID=86661 RepID=A0A9X8J0Y1_BACCE|nr:MULTISPECIES: hypothetical protein [Bacillus]KKC55843.1 membrane protein [Bacillus sp. UMTAT18]MCD1177610.1 hypothetical protein [Bacillus paranthracis]MCH5438567.1 hypothetical protein [Bacillus paranthracis]MCR6461171.1 hypothetical protein [Bacillus paranthracis]MCR9021761.1 hypothetical protein [Bacillus paranthracis]
MFFYNVMKETIRMKYVWLSILFLLNVSIIGCLFNYFETGIIKEKMNELEVLYKVMSFYNLSTIFIPLTIVFSVYSMSNFFSIYVVYRVNNALKLVSIYYLKLFVFVYFFAGSMILQLFLMSNMMAVTSVDVNYPLLFCIQLFASVFICMISALLQLFLPSLLVIICMITAVLLDRFILHGFLFTNAFYINVFEDATGLFIRLFVCLFIFFISVWILSKKSYISMNDETEVI